MSKEDVQVVPGRFPKRDGISEPLCPTVSEVGLCVKVSLSPFPFFRTIGRPVEN